jgi:hypothetical protein
MFSKPRPTRFERESQICIYCVTNLATIPCADHASSATLHNSGRNAGPIDATVHGSRAMSRDRTQDFKAGAKMSWVSGILNELTKGLTDLGNLTDGPQRRCVRDSNHNLGVSHTPKEK